MTKAAIEGRIYWGSWFREFKWWAWRLELRAHVLNYRHEIESELEMTLHLQTLGTSLQQGHTSPPLPTVPSPGHMFQCPRLWENTGNTNHHKYPEGVLFLASPLQELGT